MKNSNTSLIIMTLVSLFSLNTLFANNGIKSKVTLTKLVVEMKKSGSVQIQTNLFAQANETYTIQRSYDNKNFQAVAMVLGSDVISPLTPIKLTDKINGKAKKVFYRLIKVKNDETSTIVLSTSIATR